MSIRLLKKQEIDKAKSNERQAEIQEGLKLAKRVDALREAAAQEEKSLNDFRIRTIAEINKQIDGEIEKREEFKRENKALEEEYKILKAKKLALEAPIDLVREWDELHAAEEIVDKIKAVQDRRDDDFDKDKSSFDEEKKKFLIEKTNFEEQLKVYSAKMEYLNAEIPRFNKEKAEFEKLQTERNKQLFSRESEVESREQEVAVRESLNDKRENDLNKEKMKLEDRKKMLARTEERLFGKNNNQL